MVLAQKTHVIAASLRRTRNPTDGHSNQNDQVLCTFKDPKTELSTLVSSNVGVVEECRSFDARGHSFCAPMRSGEPPLRLTASGIEIWDFLCTFGSLLGFEPVSLEIFQFECGFLADREVSERWVTEREREREREREEGQRDILRERRGAKRDLEREKRGKGDSSRDNSIDHTSHHITHTTQNAVCQGYAYWTL